MEWVKDGYRISDRAEDLDLEAVYALLADTYWAAGRSRERIGKAVANSHCFGLYEETGKQVGFLRTLSDYATFTWICDVVVAPEYRGRGLGKWLMACMLEHPELQSTNKMLGTKDAHGLYEQFGFVRREMLRRMDID